ncbi:MAG: hypothetical protein COU08_01925 [Candidatus Harrisonbacteria bacterium CG10_big_fil_rev_8_21_14_0_10_42_17]|uniref:BioF2-like acetyltransferase domain-containing protein n=1 Tax=Candidatus Harrisonbacteria bacterium CG10_big_fil_rev_8_21_14_0_10_42_17 TaxID=1974584 RepID=A0A2M6WIF5_9BACT|nr:MAG: hypothetical protein COU08_01925 [Candidatus Harrisonbacteria bacterium CG10_big_fil_rev_8_21_14_0_10_42_17]
MHLAIKPVESREAWQSFVNAYKPQTFLHSWEWGDVCRQTFSAIFRLGLYADDTLVGVALLVSIRARRGSFLFCPHGPLFDWNNHAHVEVFFSYVTTLANQERVSFLRISPLLLDTNQHRALFQKRGFRNAPLHMHAELVWILDITPSEDDLLSNMNKNTRYSIRKAMKDDVRITTSSSIEDLDRFYAVYEKTAERQRFTGYSRDYLKKEFRMFSKTHSTLLFFGEYKGMVISTAMIIFSHGSAFYHHGASIHPYKSISASQLLQWSVIQEAKKRNCRFYNFWGVAPDDKLQHPWAGLTRFKKGFGGFSEHYVHAQDLPLRKSYWLTVFIEAIRKWKRGL